MEKKFGLDGLTLSDANHEHQCYGLNQDENNTVNIND